MSGIYAYIHPIAVSAVACMTTSTMIKPSMVTLALQWIVALISLYYTIPDTRTLFLVCSLGLFVVEGVYPSNCIIGVVARGGVRGRAAHFVCIFHQHKFLAVR